MKYRPVHAILTALAWLMLAAPVSALQEDNASDDAATAPEEAVQDTAEASVEESAEESADQEPGLIEQVTGEKSEQEPEAEQQEPREEYEHDASIEAARRNLETVDLPDEIKTEVQQTEKFVIQVNELIRATRALRADEQDADETYQAIDGVLRSRIDHLLASMREATSPSDPLVEDPDTPDEIETIEQLHATIVAIYDARLRLLEYISPLFRLELMSTDVSGTQALILELRFVLAQIHFQALSIPAAIVDLYQRVQIAPVPILWRLFLFFVAIALFRWWRRWFPETLKRARASLLEIRPRNPAVLRRVKTIWYLEQVRKPIEWLIFLNILFTMVELPGINYILEILSIIIQWILLGWFSVSVLNAISARGDVGLAGEEARLRLRTFRLLATWLVLLGLGLDLAEMLTGVATLHAWIWRLFQILAIAVLIVLLGWWRSAIFQRLELEKDGSESVQGMLKHQEGWRSYWSAASGAVWLIANRLRRSVMRQFLRFGSDQALSSVTQTTQLDSGSPTANGEDSKPLNAESRRVLLRGDALNERYSRPSRRDLVRACETEQGGIISIVGERGIGKSTMLKQLKSVREDRMLLLQCRSTEFSDLATDIAEALELRSPDPQKVAKKLESKGITEIALDDLQRLVLPVMGGQQGIMELAQFMEQVRLPIMWIVAVDSYSYQFMQRARADRATMGEFFVLQSWERRADCRPAGHQDQGSWPRT